MFFGHQRAAFLEFLRNLTPQILFLTVAFVTGSGLNLNVWQIDIQGVKNATPYFLSLAAFIGASVANVTLFIEKALTSSEALDIEIQRIKARQINIWAKLKALLFASWTHNRGVFAQVALTLIVVQAGFLSVAFIAVQSTVSALRGLR
jgi:hypothetical protein